MLVNIMVLLGWRPYVVKILDAFVVHCQLFVRAIDCLTFQKQYRMIINNGLVLDGCVVGLCNGTYRGMVHKFYSTELFTFHLLHDANILERFAVDL